MDSPSCQSSPGRRAGGRRASHPAHRATRNSSRPGPMDRSSALCMRRMSPSFRCSRARGAASSRGGGRSIGGHRSQRGARADEGGSSHRRPEEELVLASPSREAPEVFRARAWAVRHEGAGARRVQLAQRLLEQRLVAARAQDAVAQLGPGPWGFESPRCSLGQQDLERDRTAGVSIGVAVPPGQRAASRRLALRARALRRSDRRAWISAAARPARGGLAPVRRCASVTSRAKSGTEAIRWTRSPRGLRKDQRRRKMRRLIVRRCDERSRGVAHRGELERSHVRVSSGSAARLAAAAAGNESVRGRASMSAAKGPAISDNRPGAMRRISSVRPSRRGAWKRPRVWASSRSARETADRAAPGKLASGPPAAPSNRQEQVAAALPSPA